MPLAVSPRLAGIQFKRLRIARVGVYTTRMQLAQVGAVGPRRSVLAIEEAAAFLFDGARRAEKHGGGDGGDGRRADEDSHRPGVRSMKHGSKEHRLTRVSPARMDRTWAAVCHCGSCGAFVGRRHGPAPPCSRRSARRAAITPAPDRLVSRTARLVDSLERHRPRSFRAPHLKDDWGREARHCWRSLSLLDGRGEQQPVVRALRAATTAARRGWAIETTTLGASLLRALDSSLRSE